MKPSIRLLRRSLPVVLALAALQASPGAAELIERIIVRVNGDIITLSEFEQRQLAAVQAARVSGDAVEAYLRDNNAKILQDAVDELLLVQRGAEVGIRMRPEYIQEVIEGIKKENNIADDAELQKQLRREGMSIDDLKRNIERSIVRRQILQRELEGRVNVTDADARSDYEARKATEFTRNASVTLQEIVLPATASELARQLVARARKGEDFSALVKAHSTGSTASAGGDLGRLERGDLSPQLDKAAAALPKGAVSEPIPAADGLRILKVVDRQDSGVVPFAEVRDEIVKRLTQERSLKGYEDYMAGLRKTATVNVFVREVPLALSGQLGPAPGSELEQPRLELGAGASSAVPGAPVDPDAEFSVSPQVRPERVAPAPRPTPTPPAS